jgi:type IV pilus assembly protein PilN
MQVNLLPWRELKRRQKKKLVILFWVISGIFAVLTLCLLNWLVLNKITNQIMRNHMLQQEIEIFDHQIKKIKGLEQIKRKLISRMSWIYTLQLKRPMMAHLFDELVKVTPLGIFLTKIVGKNNRITLSGYAQSNGYVSKLIKNMEHNEWIHNLNLNEIKNRNKEHQVAANEFKVTFTF